MTKYEMSVKIAQQVGVDDTVARQIVQIRIDPTPEARPGGASRMQHGQHPQLPFLRLDLPRARG